MPAPNSGTWNSFEFSDLFNVDATVSQPGGPFYFAWVDPDQTVFDPYTMNVMDEDIFSFEMTHDEGQVPKLDMVIRNPREGLLAPGRRVWAWFAYQHSSGSGIIPIFFGVLVSIPTNMFAELINIQFNARSQDYIEQKQAVAETLKVAPYYDPIWLEEAHRDDPDALLEAWSKLYHVDPTTLEVSVSDVLEGEDDTVTFDQTMGIYDSVNTQLGECPLDTIQIQAQVHWTQRCVGYITGPSANISSYTGGSFKSDWPKPGASFGGGWKCEYSFVNDCLDTEHAVTRSVSSSVDYTKEIPDAPDCSTASESYSATFASNPGIVISGHTDSVVGICNPYENQDGTPGSYTIPASYKMTGTTALLWILNCVWSLRYDAKREFSEILVMNITANVQNTIVSPLVSQNTELIKITSADVGQPITTPDAWSDFIGQPVGLAQTIFPNDPTLPGGTSYQICVRAGIAGLTEPVFSDIPGTITVDGTAQWASLGEQPPTTQPEWTNSTPVGLGEIMIVEPQVFNPETGQMETTGASYFLLATTPGTTNTSYTSFTYLKPAVSSDDLPQLPVPFATILGPGDSANSNIPGNGGGSGGFIGPVGSIIHDGSVVWTNLGTSPSFLGIPIGGTMTNVTARNFFSTDRGLVSVQYLIAKARARLRWRARCVTVSWDAPFELCLGLTCRMNATLYDPRIPGGAATGKIKSYKLSADKDGKMIGHIEIGCSVGFAGSVSDITGTPEYTSASGYMQPGYQRYDGGQYALPEEDIAFTPPGFAPFDDGLVFPLQFFPGTISIVRPDQNAQLTTQMAQEMSPQLGGVPSTSGSGATTLFGGNESVAQWLNGGEQTYLLECNPVAAEILIQPVTNGPFNGAYYVITTPLEVPKGIDLEAMSEN